MDVQKRHIEWKGLPMLIVLLACVFWVTFAVGGPIQEWLQRGVDAFYGWVKGIMTEGWMRSLITDGIIQGVGSLLTALPNILILFFFLSLMEETGYLARVSYYMDGFMHRIGLHGYSFIPLLMGFGCNVPAILAAKNVQNEKERMLTMLMVPFISCSGRLPIYLLLIATVFPTHKALVLGSLYLLSMCFSLGFAAVMSKTRWFNMPADCPIHEKPKLYAPNWRHIGQHIWMRTTDFLSSVFTVIVVASVVIWGLEYFPAGDLEHLESSWLAAIGKAIEPVMRPLGFDWKMSVCLLSGLPAKEAIASTFAILFGTDGTVFSAASAYAFLIFTLLYFPCVATINTIKREINAKWATFIVIYSLVLAWVMAFIINMIGLLLQ